MSEKQASQTFSLSMGRVLVAGIRHRWRISLAVALGVAVATAVIVGALLVGDSMRGSLRELTIERLGRTDSILAPGLFFESEGIVPDSVESTALIFFPTGVIETRDEAGNTRRAGAVQLIASDEGFWDLDTAGVRPGQMPDDQGVVLNESTAAELGVLVGDEVTVRLPNEQAVPADSPLGRRDIRSEGLPRLKVVAIIPDRGLGRFSLSPSQAAPQNVYLSRSLVAETLDREGQANVILLAQSVSRTDLDIDLRDLGMTLKRVRREFPADNGETVYQYDSLTSDQLLLPEKATKRIIDELSDVEILPALTYLANVIERVDSSGDVAASLTYSTITGMDSSDELPLDYSLPGGLIDDDVVPLVVNSWTAEQLGASEGTRLRLAYYEPEVVDGKEIERSFDAVVTDVVPITKPAKPYRRRREAVFDQRPTIYNDPDLTPVVPGVTDQDSISDWDLPFRLEREISDADDVYWNDYRLTPKAFMPLADARRLFGSRFGQTTGLRLNADPADPSMSTRELETRMLGAVEPVMDDLGWEVRPIRSQQLAASRGTTPFDGLFLSLSFFVILSAVLLIAMLFRLGLVQRMREFGTLMALGWTGGGVAKLVVAEGTLIAAVGVLLGIGGGVLYAIGVLWALRSWWVGAVTVPFLRFHATPQSLVIGGLAGWCVALVTLVVTSRWLLRHSAQSLLAQREDDNVGGRVGGSTRLPIIAGAMLVAAFGLAVWGATQGGQAASGGFIGGGMLLLFASLAMVHMRLKRPRLVSNSQSVQSLAIGSLATRNASRHPMRSTMTIGLMATASFLIISIAAFQLQPTEKGTGGFDLIAQTAQPLYRDLRDAEVRADLLGPDADAVSDIMIAPMRMRLGQDASCNNLYQATEPTVLGVPKSFGGLFLPTETSQGEGGLVGFDWVAHAPIEEGQSPWDLLHEPAAGTESDPIAVVIDQNTAMWSLQMTGGIGQIRSFEYQADQPVFVRVVGLLSNSILQGRLMIGQSNFEKSFPDISGFRFFLIQDRNPGQTASILENRLGDVGMDASDSAEVLSGMLAVQNTYLKTFQSLGGLGLLLGTIGLAVAQLRSVLERRRELAIMRAIGFTNGRLSSVVMRETASLLVVGIGCGAACAILAVIPYAWTSGSSIPIMQPVLIVVGILGLGMLAGLLAVHRVTTMPLAQSLRAE